MIVRKAARWLTCTALVAALSLSLTSCARLPSAAVGKVADLSKLAAGNLDNAVDSPATLKSVDTLLSDLRSIRDPNAEEVAAIALAKNLLLYRESVAAATSLADEVEAGLPNQAFSINREVLTIRDDGKPFFDDLDTVVAEMTKSTTCSLAHDLISPGEAEWLLGERALYTADASTQSTDKAEQFLVDRLTELGYAFAEVEAVFPVARAIKRIFDVSTGTVQDLQTIAEADNPATTRAFTFYYRLCVFKG